MPTLRFATEQDYRVFLAARQSREKRPLTPRPDTNALRNVRGPKDKAMKPLRGRLCPTEEQEQMALVAWVRVHVGRWPALAWLAHIPNGGSRHIVEAVKLKHMGVLPALPDLVLLFPHHGMSGWFGEMKALDGKPTPAQRQMQKDLCALGYDAGIYYGWEAARDGLLRYLTD